MIALLLSRVSPRLWAIVGGTVALVALVGFLRWDAARDARAADLLDQQQRKTKTLERINEAISDPRTPDDIRRRLRDLAK